LWCTIKYEDTSYIKEAAMTPEERIEKMERQLVQVRWFNRCLIACIVLSLGFVYISKRKNVVQSGVKEIRASRFIIEDENRKPRVVLAITSDGPGLRLCDENGKERAVLAVTPNGPELRQYDKNANERIHLGMTKDIAILSLNDENQQLSSILSASKNGPRLLLSDENGNIRALLWVDKSGPILSLKDENGKKIWSAP